MRTVLDGATITSSSATTAALRSEIENLTINTVGTNKLSASKEVVSLVESAQIGGTGELTVTSTGSSGLIVALAGYKDITINGSVKVKASNNIITIHTHPGSMPPSASDLNSNFFNNYKMGFVACHNGKVFGYTSDEEINETLYTMYIQKFLNDGCDDFTAQMKTLQTLSQNYKIKIWEVSHNG